MPYIVQVNHGMNVNQLVYDLGPKSTSSYFLK